MQPSILPHLAAAVSTILGCNAVGQVTPVTPAAPAPRAAPAAAEQQPMDAFSRLIGGRWKMTTMAGKDTFDTWSWGPGKQSIRSMRVGTLTEGDPWGAMTVYYWHPTLKEIKLLSVGSVMRGVGEGKMTFAGDTAESFVSLYQSAGPRTLRERWTFDGRDKYHDELSEKVRDGYGLLAEWDRIRVDAPDPVERMAVPLLKPEGVPSELMRPLEKLLSNAWTSIATAGTNEPRTRTTFEYVPHVDAIYGRVEVIGADGTSLPAMDVYLYHHTGTRALRCLVLGGQGPDGATVLEGEIVPAGDGTSFTIRLMEHRSSGQQVLDARVELEEDGAARVQVSRTDGQERTMVIDRRHQRARE